MSKSTQVNASSYTFDVSQYLQRIGLSAPQTIDLDVLTTLQLAHLKAIPFENLDIHYGNSISLNLDCVYEKVINNGRGGFCYELNGLFHNLLKSLGFNAKLVSARVSRPDGSYGPEFDHLAIVVSLNYKKYLADVGFGRFAFSPILIPHGINESVEESDYRIDRQGDDTFLVSRLDNRVLLPEYLFTQKERHLPDFQEMCTHHQTSSESNFTKGKVISILTDNGRKTLTDTQLKYAGTNGTEASNFDPEDFEMYLEQEFGIIISR